MSFLRFPVYLYDATFWGATQQEPYAILRQAVGVKASYACVVRTLELDTSSGVALGAAWRQAAAADGVNSNWTTPLLPGSPYAHFR